MRIFVCTNNFETSVVGPTHFTRMIYGLNESHSEEFEVHIITENTSSIAPDIHKIDSSTPSVFRFFDVFLQGSKFNKVIKKLSKTRPPDLIIFTAAVHSLVYCSISKKNRPPVVGMINDYVFLNRTWRDLFKNRHGHYYFLNHYYQKWAVQRVDHVLVCSNYLKKELPKYYPISTDKISVLYHVPDLSKIDFQPTSFHKDEPIKVLFVKKLYHYGGLEELIEALNSLTNYYFELTIVGPPHHSYQIIKSWIPNNAPIDINFLGPLPSTKVDDLMKTHHILCIPSHFESLGIANMEGLASGISVVGVQNGGISEVLEDGNYVWLADTNEKKILANKITECIETHESKRRKIQERGKKFVLQKFDGELIRKSLIGFLKNWKVS